MDAQALRGSRRFLNRELSWLEFDRRVLMLARDAERPLLERVKFLAIFARNLDEFFQVRVANLQDLAASGTGDVSPDGRTAHEQLALLRERVLELTSLAETIWSKELRPALATHDLAVRDWRELDGEQRARAAAHFEAAVLPVLVPIAVDPAHPFPYVSNLSLSVGVIARGRRSDSTRLVRVKVPPFVPRFTPVGDGVLLPVEQLILAHLDALLPDDVLEETGLFRVTRDADLELGRRRFADLVETIEAGLRKRHRGSDAVRLEVSAALGEHIRRELVDELRLEEDEVYEAPGLLDLGALWQLWQLDRPELKDAAWTPQPVAGLPGPEQGPSALFARLRRGDFLVHHPYEAFEGSVEGFLGAAAADPAVRVIMSTIYRTGGPESGIVRALEGAASRGKQVVVLVELKARFDEAANLERARALERAGAHVVYGVMDLKTHAKLALVVRQEEDGLRRYCHVGTGNYNPVTARLYEDLGLLTSNAAITRDVAELFQGLASAGRGREYGKLLVAPETLRAGLIERIGREATEPDGHVVIKANSVSDPEMIDALYAASCAGTQVDLVVRGICCVRPGVEGLSERIRVRSVVGRFLEHSRIFRFGSARRGHEYWIGSADLMPRNLDLRVEALVPIEAPELRARIDALLALYLDAQARCWELASDGSWHPSGGTLDVQETLQARALETQSVS